MTGRVKWGCR
jgi:hypothetical protein